MYRLDDLNSRELFPHQKRRVHNLYLKGGETHNKFLKLAHKSATQKNLQHGVEPYQLINSKLHYLC